MRFLPLVLALAAPALAATVHAAHAQDGGITYDGAVMSDCLAAAGDDAARHACIGAASDGCMAAPGGASTVGMNQCLTAEKDDWDVLLNDNYATLVERAKTEDAARDQAAAQALPLLQKMQRDWIAFRDSSCIYAASGFQGGTAAGPAAGACLLQLTGEQALRLGAMARDAQ